MTLKTEKNHPKKGGFFYYIYASIIYMQNISKEKKYFLIVALFVALGALLLFISPINQVSKVTGDGVTKEATSSGLDISNIKQDKFNQAIVDGDKSFLSKDYQQSIIHYNEALSYVNSQIAYMRLFNTYNIMGDNKKAIEVIDKAIALKPMFTDYWNTKMQYLDEKTDMSFTELKAIYTQGLSKVDSKSKVNLITVFARIAENKGEKVEAIKLWQKAIELVPENKIIYQAEIDRLNR